MCVSYKVGAETRWADEVSSGCGRVLRVGEVEGTGHRMKSDGIVVHIHRGEGDHVCALIRYLPGGRLDGVYDL